MNENSLPGGGKNVASWGESLWKCQRCIQRPGNFNNVFSGGIKCMLGAERKLTRPVAERLDQRLL